MKALQKELLYFFTQMYMAG